MWDRRPSSATTLTPELWGSNCRFPAMLLVFTLGLKEGIKARYLKGLTMEGRPRANPVRSAKSNLTPRALPILGRRRSGDRTLGSDRLSPGVLYARHVPGIAFSSCCTTNGKRTLVVEGGMNNPMNGSTQYGSLIAHIRVYDRSVSYASLL